MKRATIEDVLGDDAEYLGVTGGSDFNQEAIFVEEYVRSGDLFMSCLKAGIRDPRYPMEVVARKTLARPEIQAAIAVLKRVAPKGADGGGTLYTREFLLQELQQTHEQALQDRAYGPAISAIKEQASLLGYHEQTVNIRVSTDVRSLSLDELRAMVARGATGEVIEGESRVVSGGIGSLADMREVGDE